jgi:hypothetical protein
MNNLAMEQRLKAGTALSVLVEGREIQTGLYELRRFVEDRDYCDPKRETWIWSIGRNFLTGKIVAATDVRFYDDPTWECLFVR